MNSRSPIKRGDFQIGKRPLQTIQKVGPRFRVRVPRRCSSVQINGTPMPFQIAEIIKMLIVVLPNSQLVRSIARTQGLPRIPNRSATTRAVMAPSSSICWRTDRTGGEPIFLLRRYCAITGSWSLTGRRKK